jgi:probable F420-dependent oxidoreductase
MAVPPIGRVGVWSMEMRFGDPAAIAEAAAELDALGYGALWIPGGIDDTVLASVDLLLGATKRITIATGIINVWKQQPVDVAAWYHALSAEHRTRVWLGLGISHAPIIGADWTKPIAKMREWLDGAEAAGLPADAMCLAALGPQMVALSGKRSGGAHPYLIDPNHTKGAREILGPGKVLAPEQGVVLESDPAKARELARGALAHYRNLPNYCNSWARLGYTEAEIADLSDRFIDGIFGWGSAEQIAARIKKHHDAGADHVCIQAINAGGLEGVRQDWRELAKVLL